MKKGTQSILFDKAPYIVSSACIVGNKESEGPLGNLFDEYDKSDLFGQKTWELAESKMQQRACEITLAKAGKKSKEVRFLYGGDLLRQGIATSIDALSVGFAIAHYNFMQALVCGIIIAIVTFFICMAGVIIGKSVGAKFSKTAAVLGGVILIIIGLEVFITGVF